MIKAVKELLKRPVAYHPILAKLTGSVSAAVMLSQGMYWQEISEHDGKEWFWVTANGWLDQCGLTQNMQDTAREILRKTDFWFERRAGLPAKLYYRIDAEILVSRITGYLDGERIVYRKTGNKESALRDTSNGRYRKQAVRKTDNKESISILKENSDENINPVSEKETVALTTFSPGEKIQNLEVIVVEGVEFSLDADFEQTCSGAGGETQQCSTYDLYAALEAKKDKPVRDHDSKILQDFVNMGTPEQFEETKRRMTKKANNADAAEIITHLNTATGSQFRTTAKANLALVNARMKEGATGDDMKLIIDHKNEQWGTDAKMREHLCPETLFRAGHYEKYINAARKWQQDKTGPVHDRYAMNDSPKACTPDEMVREMSFFYRMHIHDGDDGRGLLSAAQKHAQTAYGPDRLNEVVRAFCSHRIGKGLARETFEQQHGALCLWLQNEKKREQRGQGGPAVFNPSDIRAQQRRANVED